MLEALSMNSSGQTFYWATSLKQKLRSGCYEIFLDYRAAGLLQDHSELHYFEAFTSNTYLLVAYSTTLYQLHNLFSVK
jgi:hypothetical protein